MYPWSCNPPSCGRNKNETLAEAHRRHWRAPLLVALLLALRGVCADAQAATGTPGAVLSDSTDPLLGSLSFTSSDDPVEVTATSLEFDYRARILIYRGDVVAKQGDVKLTADILTLALADGDASGVRRVVAEGNVRFSKGARRASAGRAEFDQSKRLIVLENNAVLEDDRGNVSGDSVRLYLDEGRTVVEGGKGRVRAVLRPANDADESGAARGDSP